MGTGTAGCGDDCLETLEEIERFLDGETTDLTAASIERHLGDCSPCMDRAEFQKALKALVAKTCGNDQVPDDLKARILSGIREGDTSG